MNDSILNDPGTKIDARSLIVSEPLRGAIVGFCWSLVVTVPVAMVLWAKFGEFVWAMVAMATISTIWSAVAAFTERWQTREETFTAEQRAVLRHHIRIARIIAACLTVPAVSIILIAWFIGPNPTVPSPILIAVLVSLTIRVMGYLIVRVGRAQGYAAVRMMQQQTRHVASRIDIRPLTLAGDIPPSTLVQPSKDRITERQPTYTIDDD